MPSYPDEPDILLPHGGRVVRPGRARRIYILLAAVFVAFLLFQNAVPLYTDWLWFREVGYVNVFTTTILTKTWMFLVFGALFFLILYLNLRLARRMAPEETDRFLMERLGPEWSRALKFGLGWILLIVSLLLALWAGRIAADYWVTWLQFANWTPFHLTDPVFGNDVGFYVFRVPFLRYVWGFLLATFLLTTAAVIALHVADRAIESWSGLPNVARGVRTQLLMLLGALALIQAFGTRLDGYELLNAENGVFSGAGYVDLHVRLFAINVQTVILVLTALACVISIWGARNFRWPVIGAGAWLLAVIVIGGIAPGAVQALFVTPNQFSAEGPYIARNIEFTRLGFGLQNVRNVNTFPADQSLTAAGLQQDRDTLANVRLWDYNYLGKVYSQLQSVKTYYKFEKDDGQGNLVYNIDIDRYMVGDKYRQVMLAAREMDTSGLPSSAHTWQNERLGYTHGYGLAMSPVNDVQQGAPDYFVKDIPLTVAARAAGLRVTQPDIYYGELTNDYVFTDTTQQEFDYPSTDLTSSGGTQDHYTNYQGRGGIRIGDSPLAKLAFSLRLGDANILLAHGFTSSTRLLFRRDIRRRVRMVAPWLQLDEDPYLVANPVDGRLVWIMDAYTLSDQYPYSTPAQIAVTPDDFIAPNYIRNSVKVVVDAYDGTVNLYIADPQDPIVRTFAKVFPGLLKPLSDLPAGLRDHLRYPEDLFRVQRAVYATYHVDDPRVFYLKEDAWSVPIEPNADQSAGAQAAQMEPYYVIMRLPAGTDGPAAGPPRLEFLLMSPMAPINREDKNILGWMCARCDGDHYGQLVLYRFPQTAAVNGPSQIVSLINSDPVVSPKLTLLRSGGSTAAFGNILVIPVEKSLLYVAPLYIESTTSPNKLPQLQKVVVAYGTKEAHVAMEDTLDGALSDLFPGYAGRGQAAQAAPALPAGAPAPPVTGPSRVPADVRALIDRASADSAAAQQKLKAGDFAAYGAAVKDLQATLTDLSRAAGGATPRR